MRVHIHVFSLSLLHSSPVPLMLLPLSPLNTCTHNDISHYLNSSTLPFVQLTRFTEAAAPKDWPLCWTVQPVLLQPPGE